MSMIRFKYKNHRGVIEERQVEPVSLDYAYRPNPEYGYPAGWFLHCKDYTRGRNGEPRSFFLGNIILPEDVNFYRLMLL